MIQTSAQDVPRTPPCSGYFDQLEAQKIKEDQEHAGGV